MYKTTILASYFVTHNVKRFILTKPKNFLYTPGQATEFQIDLNSWKGKKRPFTFTSLNSDKILELTVKGYNDHNGVTKKLHSLKPGNRLLMDKPWGTIKYKGPGMFIAGGAGITPFISIFRDLKSKNRLEGNSLIFSNKEKKDIILEKELVNYFSKENLHLILTREKANGYEYGRIDKKYLLELLTLRKLKRFYICGPGAMVNEINEILIQVGAKPEAIVFER